MWKWLWLLVLTVTVRGATVTNITCECVWKTNIVEETRYFQFIPTTNSAWLVQMTNFLTRGYGTNAVKAMEVSMGVSPQYTNYWLVSIPRRTNEVWQIMMSPTCVGNDTFALMADFSSDGLRLEKLVTRKTAAGLFYARRIK